MVHSPTNTSQITVSLGPSSDIRDLISVDDVMAEMGLGPNGALLYCMECVRVGRSAVRIARSSAAAPDPRALCLHRLLRHLMDQDSWLHEHLESFLEDDYILIDCPGQIELYSHVPVMKKVHNVLSSRVGGSAFALRSEPRGAYP